MIDVFNLADIFYRFFSVPNIKTAGNKEYWAKWYKKNKETFKETVLYHKRKRRKELQAIIEQAKNIPCKICHGKFHPAAMDLVHRDLKDKKFSFRDATRLIHSKERLQEEIAKCDVVCANCVKQMKMESFLKETGGKGSRDRRRKKLKAIIDEVKTNACSDCRKQYAPYVMELDHLDGDTKVDSVSKMINKERPIKMIMDELAKTESICTNCHRVRTYKRAHGEDL